MKEKIITDAPTEKLTIRWDGERFGLVRKRKGTFPDHVILLNPKEMMGIVEFASTLGEKE